VFEGIDFLFLVEEEVLGGVHFCTNEI
jgi:hypothetical protein